MLSDKLEVNSRRARRLVIEKCNEVGGVHIGGSFSCIDFLVTFYQAIYEDLNETDRNLYYDGKLDHDITLVVSKGHCYIAQLAALDAVFGRNEYLAKYFQAGSDYFGHPKRSVSNLHFPVSSGSLGQGLTFANGLALANKINNKGNKIVVSLVGDGEMQEGVTYEALNFLSQHKLNHTVVLDNNNQISLGKSSDILSLGTPVAHLETSELLIERVDGHCFSSLNILAKKILKNNSRMGRFVELKTVKGKGVSFMEGVFKWHHRRFRDGEFAAALEELSGGS